MQKFGIGQRVSRVEDRRFVSGAGQFVDDIQPPRLVHAVVVYSPHACADIVDIDLTAARAAPGVLMVLSGADAIEDGIGGLPAGFDPALMGGPAGYRTVQPLLVADRVRMVGDRIALVVAESVDEARDAADLIAVEYRPLPLVASLEAAVAADAPLVWEDCPGNRSYTWAFGDAAATEAAFAGAAHIVSLDIRNQRVSANSIEPRSSIGMCDPATGDLTLYTSSQNPHGVRQALSNAIFRIPEMSLRVISPDVGGGFGLKGSVFPEDALVLWASRRLKRPVKWTATRSDAMMGDAHGRDQSAHAEMALDERGRALALRVEAHHALGAYAYAGGATVMFAMQMLSGPYAIPAIDARAHAIFTNSSPTTPYRGAGRPEACYVLERLMDEAALALGIDRVEIRRRNLVPANAMPYTGATGVTIDSGDFERILDECLALADWNGFEDRRAASERKGLLRGRAITSFIEISGIFNERMDLRFDPDGNVTILAGTHSHGQGHATVFPQLVHEWLGVPYDKIRYVQGDTEKVAMGRGTYAARSSSVGGSALHAAAQNAIAQGARMAAHLLEGNADDISFDDGTYKLAGTNRTIPFGDVVRAFFRPAGLPQGFEVGFTANGSAQIPPNFPNGCQICELEIDPRTGVVKIDRYTAVDDVGRVLNPMICEGQVVGGLAQGVGQALLEEVIYDPETGQLLTGSFSDYGMPHIDMLPPITSKLEEIPCRTNPLGVKGIGESGTVAAPPTVVNAALDALRPLGVKALQMPLTPYRIWSAIKDAQTGHQPA